jgi:hypothetical protein
MYPDLEKTHPDNKNLSIIQLQFYLQTEQNNFQSD